MMRRKQAWLVCLFLCVLWTGIAWAAPQARIDCGQGTYRAGDTVTCTIGAQEEGANTLHLTATLYDVYANRMWSGTWTVSTPFLTNDYSFSTANWPVGTYRIDMTAKNDAGRDSSVATGYFALAPPPGPATATALIGLSDRQVKVGINGQVLDPLQVDWPKVSLHAASYTLGGKLLVTGVGSYFNDRADALFQDYVKGFSLGVAQGYWDMADSGVQLATSEEDRLWTFIRGAWSRAYTDSDSLKKDIWSQPGSYWKELGSKTIATDDELYSSVGRLQYALGEVIDDGAVSPDYFQRGFAGGYFLFFESALKAVTTFKDHASIANGPKLFTVAKNLELIASSNSFLSYQHYFSPYKGVLNRLYLTAVTSGELLNSELQKKLKTYSYAIGLPVFTGVPLESLASLNRRYFNPLVRFFYKFTSYKGEADQSRSTGVWWGFYDDLKQYGGDPAAIVDGLALPGNNIDYSSFRFSVAVDIPGKSLTRLSKAAGWSSDSVYGWRKGGLIQVEFRDLNGDYPNWWSIFDMVNYEMEPDPDSPGKQRPKEFTPDTLTALTIDSLPYLKNLYGIE